MHLLSSLAWLAIGANAWSMDFASGTVAQAGTDHNKPGSHKGKTDGKCASTVQQCFTSYGYYPNWGVYAKKFFVTDIRPDYFSHISYAFANANNKTGEVVLSDPYADVQYVYPGDDTKAKGTNLFGNLKQLYKLKKEHRYLNTILAIGGFTYSPNIALVLAKQDRRETFAKSAVTLVRDLGFDGIEIDYEYMANELEAVQMVDLLRRLREGLDKLRRETGARDPFLITYACPAGEEHYKVLRLADMAQYVDIFNIMAVDYAGASFSKKTGYLDNLYPDKKNPAASPFNTNSAVQYYKSKVPASKITLQNPLYGSAFANTDGIGRSFKGAGTKGSLDVAGTWFVKDLHKTGYNLKVTSDPVVGAAYSYSKQDRYLIAHDTVDVVRQKAEYVQNQGLAGTSFWEISQDNPMNDAANPSLIAAAIQKYGGVGAVKKRENNLLYPFSKYDNIKKGLPCN